MLSIRPTLVVLHAYPEKPKQTHQACYGQDHPLPSRVLHGKKEPSRTQTDGQDTGYLENVTSDQ